MSVLARVRPDLVSFGAYASARRAGFDGAIHLDANESPWAPIGAPAGSNRYPDPQPARLRTRLAALYGVGESRLWMGRGSDEAIDLLLRAFCGAGRDNVVTLAPTFGMYAVGARLQGATCRELALDAKLGFALDPECLLAMIDANTKLVIVCSPNNPTGTLYHETLEFLAESLSGRAMLVVDEAYIEFASQPSAAALIDRHQNMAVLRTLSKAHGLAGARIGAMIAHEEIARFIGRIAAPYPLASPCVELALAALEPTALACASRRVRTVVADRERLVRLLEVLPCVGQVWASSANFVLARFRDKRAAFDQALAAGIVLRDVSRLPGLDGCLRITVGAPEENDALVAALADPMPVREVLAHGAGPWPAAIDVERRS